MDKNVKDTIVKYAKYRLPVYLIVPLLILWTSLLVGCHVIPTHYTTTTEQENLSRQNTLLQIELYKRYDKMDPEIRAEFLSKNVEFAILIEEILCGEVKDAALLFEQAKKQKADLGALLVKPTEGDSE